MLGKTEVLQILEAHQVVVQTQVRVDDITLDLLTEEVATILTVALLIRQDQVEAEVLQVEVTVGVAVVAQGQLVVHQDVNI